MHVHVLVHVCVGVCVRACMSVCLCMCVRARSCASVCERERERVAMKKKTLIIVLQILKLNPAKDENAFKGIFSPHYFLSFHIFQFTAKKIAPETRK